MTAAEFARHAYFACGACPDHKVLGVGHCYFCGGSALAHTGAARSGVDDTHLGVPAQRISPSRPFLRVRHSR